MMEKREIYQKAQDLLSDLKIARVPTPLPRVARSLGISIEYAPLDEELSGMAFIKDGIKKIWVNSLHHPNRQRFTIAHEIAHHCLHAEHLESSVHVDKGILRRDTVSQTGTESFEVEANAFASELLVPKSQLSDFLSDDFDLDDETKVATLAKKFMISNAAMQFRLMRIT